MWEMGNRDLLRYAAERMAGMQDQRQAAMEAQRAAVREAQAKRGGVTHGMKDVTPQKEVLLKLEFNKGK